MPVKRHVIEQCEGLAPAVAHYFGGMEEVRAQLREAVEGLPEDLLVCRSVAGCHSIGALLLHIGEAEWYWMNCVVEGREITDEDRAAVFWDALEKEQASSETVHTGMTVRQCLDIIDEQRERTRRTLADFGDEDLERIFIRDRRDGPHEFSLRWLLHHLIDHEAQHKGQILMLKRLLANRES
ncbi:MAG TPA: DinB family protein [Pyrinomonadaceae bacterium]|nr:DinB family protein [Pyrinomonadaceae bacterium]